GEVDHGPLDAPAVHLPVEEPADLGAQVFGWEFATAVAGVSLGVNPFDQPDVESAKVAARTALAGAAGGPTPTVTVDEALALVRPGDALVLTAFVDPSLQPQLEQVRRALGDRLGLPTTLGVGPRFLHSTGQLHKGGPDRIVVLQVLEAPPVGSADDVAVPGQDYTFAQLLTAQADGDAAALVGSGHRVARVSLRDLLSTGDRLSAG
ncbi:MAG: glucose-6-phosphate isomerase, partial [Actinomycetes bacterium]